MADNNGGAAYSKDSASISNSTFTGNSADGKDSKAIYYAKSITFENTKISK